MMGTRSGDIDPGVLFFLTRDVGIPFDQLDRLLNKESGLLGVSGLSNDMRELHKAAGAGNARALLALEMFAYRVKKYIGAYLAVLDGCDAVVFTGGIGEWNPVMRARICSGMEAMGISLVADRNDATLGFEAIISAPESRIALLVIPTNEELEIAAETDCVVREWCRSVEQETLANGED